jgi:hypothetical protein
MSEKREMKKAPSQGQYQILHHLGVALLADGGYTAGKSPNGLKPLKADAMHSPGNDEPRCSLSTLWIGVKGEVLVKV